MTEQAVGAATSTNGIIILDVNQLGLQKSRIAHLNRVREAVQSAQIEEIELEKVPALLFQLSNRYTDKTSTRSIIQCLDSLLQHDKNGKYLGVVLRQLFCEISRPRLAPIIAVFQLEFAFSTSKAIIASPELWDVYGNTLVKIEASALNACLSSTSRGRVKSRAFRLVKRSFKTLLSSEYFSHDNCISVIRLLTNQPSEVKNAPALGVFSEVLSFSKWAAVIGDSSEDLCSFFCREIAGSKSPLPEYISTALNPFFSNVSFDHFEAQVLPALEKGVLRSPEVILDNVLTSVISSLNSDYDLSAVLHKRLMKPLVSAIKSSDVRVRRGAVAGFISLLSRCKDNSEILKVMIEIVTPMKESKVTSVDQRIAYSDVVAGLDSILPVSSKLVSALGIVASKESNETALRSELDALSHHLIVVLRGGEILPSECLTALTKGCQDKKVSICKLWVFAAGRIYFALKSEQLLFEGARQFIRAFLVPLLPAWKEIIINPVAAAQAGVIPVSFTVTSVLLSPFFTDSEDPEITKLASSFQLIDHLSSPNPNSFFLFNPRGLSKVTNMEEITWYIRALEACSRMVMTPYKDNSWKRAWCQSAFYCITSSSLSFQGRRQAFDMLKLCYHTSPEELGVAVLDSVWQWLQLLYVGDKDSLAVMSQTGKKYLNTIVSAIFPLQQLAKLPSRQLIQAVVLCQTSLIPDSSWIQLCLRGGIDPNEFVTANKAELLSEILNTETSHPMENCFELRKAMASAAADLAFVAPDVVFPYWIKQVVSDFVIVGLSDIGPTEIGIYLAPEGEPFVNVLDNSTVVDVPAKKTTKDYDTLKWEQEVRDHLAKKNGGTRKLTVEERAKVAAQVKTESELRFKMRQMQSKLLRGVSFVQSVLESPLVAFDRWILQALGPLLAVIKSDKENLLTYSAATTYMNCSSCVTDRLESTRRSVGTAILRANGVQLPETSFLEPLNELATRVLYRIRISSESYPLDVISLSYVLPLILHVLSEGGVGTENEDDAEEQIVLALESLALHTQQASDCRLPRSDILRCLLNSLSRFPSQFKLVKEGLLSYTRAISGDITTLETDILLEHSISADITVRTVALQAIDTDLDLGNEVYREQIWIACHDEVLANSTTAKDIMLESGFKVPSDAVNGLVTALSSLNEQQRGAAARALGSTIALHPAQFEFLVKTLQETYVRCIPALSKPPSGTRGISRRVADAVDQWQTRSGVALGFRELAPVFTPSELPQFLQLLIDYGGFQDSDPTVRQQLIAAATAIITHRGESQVEALFSIFESGLDGESKSDSQDLLREAIVILYGTVATHLPPGDERIPVVTKRLLGTLGTPSETVQQAIADCLPALVKGQPSAVPEYIAQLENDLLRSGKYGSQRGAAYGIAGVVHGCGIAAVREHQLLEMLSSAVNNRKEPSNRRGAFLAYELLPTILGRAFEPYLIEIVPQLLAGFGDTSPDVRVACLDAAKAAFATLSSYGVKTILPTLLSGLDDTQWRSKKGACELLGAMAFLDPRQLAERLPEIIPPLTTVLADSHKEVRTAANRSLARFGDVLRNPEIHAVVDDLLAALSDPTRYTEPALDKLIRVSFVHYLDAPSLAVVVRVLERGLADRSSAKQKSAQIIASLAHLADKADLLGHLPVLVAGLRASAVDPVPATRATASKALGTLVEKLGEDSLPDLIPSLMETLRADVPAGDRLGSAQALSEVLAGLGTGRLEETLPTILQGVRSPNFAVREGFMSLFVFLPACFGSSFAAYLGRLIPPILSGLADEVETIRETALRAARLLVKNFAARAVDLFLPELERGLGDDSHRIRLSSAELVGDLLFNIAGLSKADAAEEAEENHDEIITEAASLSTNAGTTLLSVLGQERRNRIFAALYVCRSDTSPLVRTTAVTIWKALVASPRMLRELVPSVSRLVVRRLSSSSAEQRTIAAAALGDLVRKAGDGVLGALLPTFEAGLGSSDVDLRRGICLGLRELLGAVTAEDIAPFDKSIFAIIQDGLVDADADVRTCAAEAFDSLQDLIGKRAVERVLPDLLSRLYSSDGSDALRGLLTLLTDSERAATIVPNVLPPLLNPPMSSFNARALAAFAGAAPSVLLRRLQAIVHAMVDAIVSSIDESLQSQIRSSLDDVLIAMADSESLDSTLNILLQLVKHDDPIRRAESARRLTYFFSHVQSDYSRYDADLLHALVARLDDSNEEVVLTASGALGAFTGALTKPRMEALVSPARDALRLVGTPGTILPGFSLPRGPGVILPIFVYGLTTGSGENRTVAALALSDLISRADSSSLKPFAIQLTGALIRVVSDRSPEVRAAVLLTLVNLLQTAPTLLKSFLPQLQRAFAKSLTDPASDIIRARAAEALGNLIVLTPRVDPLVVELVSAYKSSRDPSVKATIFKSLYDVAKVGGQNMSPTSRSSILDLVSSDLTTDSAVPPLSLLVRHAALVAILVPILEEDEVAKLLRVHVIEASSHYSAMLIINALLIESPTTLTSSFFAEQARDLVVAGINTTTNETLCVHSIMAAGKILLSSTLPAEQDSTVEPLLKALGSSISTQNVAPIRRIALVVLRAIGHSCNSLVVSHLGFLIPLVYDAVRDRNMQVKMAAETAFISLLDVVVSDSSRFDEYMNGNEGMLSPIVKRSMTEYFRRVATRLASQERERQDAEGGQGGLGLSNQQDDLEEIWRPYATSQAVII